MSLFSSLGQGPNDIWSITGISFASPVNDILDKENFTIEELLQEDELLQEVKSRNGRLIEFMTQEEVMDKLISYIITKGDSSEGDLRLFKFPYMSCEVLCCEIPDILHILVEDCDGRYLKKLFSILDLEEPLDHYLAGYFEKTLEMLFRRMTIPVMTFLNKGGIPLLQKFLNHINNYSIMQIVQRLLLPHIPFSIGTVDRDSVPVEDRQNCQCNWSFLEETCGLLCDKMLTEGLSDVPSHVSDLLITVLQLSPPDAQFISHLCDASCLQKLLSHAFADNAEVFELSLQLPHPAANVSLAAISVLESLVSRLCETMNPFDAMGVEMPPEQIQQATQQVKQNTDKVSQSLLPAIVEAGKQLKEHIRAGGKTPPCGDLISQTRRSFPRLGHRGLQLVKLVEAMLKLGNSEIDTALCSNSLVQTCVELMFQFDLHSLLHFAVQRIVVMILEGGPSRRLSQRVLIEDCQLLGRIMNLVKPLPGSTPSSSDSSATATVPPPDEEVQSLGNSEDTASSTQSAVLGDKRSPIRRPVIGHLIQIAQAIAGTLENEEKEKPDNVNFDELVMMDDSSGTPARAEDTDGDSPAASTKVDKLDLHTSNEISPSLRVIIESHSSVSFSDWDGFVHTTLQQILDTQISNINTENSANRSSALLMDSLPRTVLSDSAVDIDEDDDDDDDFDSSLRIGKEVDMDLGAIEHSLESISLDDNFGTQFVPTQTVEDPSRVRILPHHSTDLFPPHFSDEVNLSGNIDFGDQSGAVGRSSPQLSYISDPHFDPFQADFEFANFDNSNEANVLSQDVVHFNSAIDFADFETRTEPTTSDLADPFFDNNSSRAIDELFPEVSTGSDTQKSELGATSNNSDV